MGPIRRLLCISIFPLAFALPSAVFAQQTRTVDVEGWTLHIGAGLTKPGNKALRDGVVRTLSEHLKRIKAVLKPAMVSRLQQVKLWSTLKSKRFPGLVYHPSAKWLSNNGFNPAMAKGIQIANAAAFIRRKDTPWSVMHELAHAYHHQVLGYKDARLLKVYGAAKASGRYLKVKRINARPQKHYGLNNAREFFAEMTEAYLGTNDFFPFERKSLERFDPSTYRVIDGIWRPHLRKAVVRK